MKSFYPSLNDSIATPAHGGNLLEECRRDAQQQANQQQKTQSNKRKWIDLSSAVNRHPWPIPSVPNFLWNELPDQSDLISAAKHYYQRTNFIPLSGTQQAIECLPNILFSDSLGFSKKECHKPKVCVPKIGYQEHKFAWEKWGYDIEYYETNTNDVALFDVLIKDDWDILVLIQPNNPSSDCFTLQQVECLIQSAENRKGYLIIDEAFIDSSAEKSILSLFSNRLIESKQESEKTWSDSLIVLRSVGKFFGLAGARLGFLFSSVKILKHIALSVGPWPVSTPSLWLVTQALLDQEWQHKAQVDLRRRRQRFELELRPLLEPLFRQESTFPWIKDDTSIKENVPVKNDRRWVSTDLFFTVFSQESKQVFTHLKRLNIHTRLGEGWLRFALPADEEFETVKDRIRSILPADINEHSKQGLT